MYKYISEIHYFTILFYFVAGNLVSETGTILQMNSKSAWMTEHFFAVGGPVHGQHYNSQSFLKYRKWQYFGIVYDFNQGIIIFIIVLFLLKSYTAFH